MPKNATDLATAAIIDVTRARTANPGDVARVTGRIATLLADLFARRVTATLIDSAAIPDAYFPDLVRLFGEVIAPNFGRETQAETVLGMESRLTQLSRYATASPIVLTILEQLELFGASAQSLDAAAILRRLPGICSELALRKVIYIADPARIPAAAESHFARYVAASLCNPQRVPDMREAEIRLRQLRAPQAPYPPADVSYW